MEIPSRHTLGALLLAAVIGTGCAGARPAPADPRPAAAPSPVRAVNPADVQFIAGMIHHHAQALLMAELARTHAASEAVRTLSERIHISQTDEIRLMQQWLADMGQPVPEVHIMDNRVMLHGADHDMLMPGMLTEEQISRLESARGPEFDRLFLTYMIQHHEGALDMVEELLASHGAANDDFIYRMASETFAEQGIEIDRMQRLLDALGGSP